MDIKTKFNVGEKVCYPHNSILTVVKNNPFYTDKEIFDHCYREGFVVGIKISFDVNDEKPRINYIVSDNVDVDDGYLAMYECCGAMYGEDLVTNNREEIEKTIHDIHTEELKMMNEKIMNLMK